MKKLAILESMPNPTVNQILEAIAETSSRNEKLELLKKYEDNADLQRTCYLALNPMIKFWIKKIPESLNTDPTETLQYSLYSLSQALDILEDEFVTRLVTGNAAIERLRNLLTYLSFDDQEVIKKIINRDLRCGISDKTVNKIWKKLIPVFEPMACARATSKNLAKMEYPAFVQKKEDGARLVAIVTPDGVTYHSRNGKEVSLFGVFDAPLIEAAKAEDKSFVLDGELLAKKNTKIANRQTGNGLMTKAIRGTLSEEEAKSLHFVIWDLVDLNHFIAGYSPTIYSERWKALFTLYIVYGFEYKPNLSLVYTREVSSLVQAQEEFRKALEAEHEGIILKDKRGAYKNKRVDFQIKFKAEKTADLRIKGVIRGTGKNEDRMGALNLYSDDGLVEVSVGTGFSDKDREWFWDHKDEVKGKIVEILYNDVIQDKNRPDISSLFLPVFKATRDDKDTTNSLDELK